MRFPFVFPKFLLNVRSSDHSITLLIISSRNIIIMIVLVFIQGNRTYATTSKNKIIMAEFVEELLEEMEGKTGS